MGGGWRPRACCVFEQRRCGFQSSHRVSYFKSIPGEVAPSASCGYRVNLLPKVCQVRLDFIDLQTKPMSHGLCDPNIQLEMKSAGLPSSWNIRVSQITCDAPRLQAPLG